MTVAAGCLTSLVERGHNYPPAPSRGRKAGIAAGAGWIVFPIGKLGSSGIRSKRMRVLKTLAGVAVAVLFVAAQWAHAADVSKAKCPVSGKAADESHSADFN